MNDSKITVYEKRLASISDTGEHWGWVPRGQRLTTAFHSIDTLDWLKKEQKGQNVLGAEMSSGIKVTFCHLTFLSSEAETPTESPSESEGAEEKEVEEGDLPTVPPELPEACSECVLLLPPHPHLTVSGLRVRCLWRTVHVNET